MTVDQQWIGDIFRNYAGLVHIDIINVINDVNTTALARVGGFNDPNILFRLMLLQLLVVVVEVAELVWQNVCVRAKVKRGLAETLLQPHDIEAKSILTSDLIRLREVVYLLVLVETFVLVAFAGARAPQNVPFMAVG